MSRHITLAAFERIDSLLSQQLHAGDFETCADPRGYIATSNRLLDACIDAMGFNFADHFASAEECAAAIVARALTHVDFVNDEAVEAAWEKSNNRIQDWPIGSFDGAADMWNEL